MKKLIAYMTLSIAVVSTFAVAQDATNSAAEPEINPEMASKQEFIKQQFTKLISKMNQVAAKLEKSQPDVAKILRQAADQATQANVSGDMEKVIKSLQQGLAADAATTESGVLDELRKVLAILSENVLKPSDIDTAQKMSDLLNKMIPEQKDLAKQSEMTRDAQKIQQQMNDLSQRLKDVVSEQKDLMKKAQDLKDGDPGLQKLAQMRQDVQDLLDKQQKLREAVDAATEMDKLALQGEQQKNLADKAAEVAKKLDDAKSDPQISDAMKKAGADSKSMADASQSTSKASKSMSQAGDSLSKTDADSAAKKQDQAVFDLKKALEAMDSAMAKASGNTPAGDLAKKQKDLQQRTDQIEKDAKALAEKTNIPTKTDNLSKASDEMGKAGDKLAGQKPQDAVDHQKEALKNLEDKKLNKLAELERRIAEKLKETSDKQAKKQGDLADRMKKLADDMAKPTDKSPDGMPGKQSMSKAGQSGKSAQGKLSQSKSDDANKDQQEAQKKMEEAKQQLDEAIAKAQQDEQEKTMTKIAEILQDMLTRQQVLTAKTGEVASKQGADGKFQRPEELELQNVSHDEGVLADDSKKVTKLLTDDKSTVIFPEIMKDIEGDLRDLQTMLDAKQVDELTQAMQGNVERNLTQLLDALKKEMSKKKQKPKQGGGGGGGGGGGKKDPLVPPTAELKMLKFKEIGIENLTVIADKQKQSGKALPTQVEAQHKKLAQQQKDLQTRILDFKKMLDSQKGPMQ